MAKRKTLKSREERTHNVVPIVPYDNTSQAYHRETSKPTEAGISFYVSIAVWVLFIISIFFLYELAVETWERIK